MDEIEKLAIDLEAAIKKQRACRGRTSWPDNLDSQVRDICDALLDASGADGLGGCPLCQG